MQTQAYIAYYIENQLWNSLVLLCNEELRKGIEPTFVFWKAFGIFKQGGMAEAIRQIEGIHRRQDIQYAATVSLIQFHKACKIPDHEAITALEDLLPEAKTLANDKSLFIACQFYFYMNDQEEAMSHLNIILGNNPSYLPALLLKADIYLNHSEGNEHVIEQGMQIIESVLKDSPAAQQNLMGLLIKSKFYQLRRDFQKAIDTLNEACVLYKKFIPSVILKTKAHIVASDWEQCTEYNAKVLQMDATNPEGLFISIFYQLTRESNINQVLERMADLENALIQREPKNAHLFYFYSKVLARVCGRRQMVLQRSLRLLERADKLTQSSDADIVCELGYQLSLLGDYQAAFKTYQQAASLDQTGNNMEPLYGMIYCKVRQDMLDEAAEQLEFLNDIQTDNKQAMHLFLMALVEWKKHKNKDKSIALLNKCLSLHVQSTKGVKAGFEFYIKLNPDFLLELAKEFVQHIGIKQLQPGQKVPPFLGKAIKLLENVTKQNSGFTEAQLLLAKSRWAAGDNAGALRELQNCMHVDPNLTEAHILSAMINLNSGSYKAAETNLHQAFSQDFKIRGNPLFMLIKSEVEMKNEEYRQALGTLEAAFQLPGVMDSEGEMTEAMMASKARAVLPFGDQERAKIFLNLAIVHTELGNHEAAKKVIAKAISQFKDTEQEVRIIVAQSRLFLKQGDVKKALNMLKKIDKESDNFVMARQKMAEIYLSELKDRRSYTKCYQDILTEFPTAENHKLGGDALMKIQEPQEAIKLYQRAYDMTQDAELVRLIGNALVMTHDYSKAIGFYEHTLEGDPTKMDLRKDLAMLYSKKKDWEPAKRCIITALRALKQQDPEDMQTQKYNVEFLVMMADVILNEQKMLEHSRMAGAPLPMDNLSITRQDALQALKDARAQQIDIVAKSRDQDLDTLDEEREISAKISHKIGMYFLEFDKNDTEAAKAFMESVNKKVDYIPSLMSLAELGAKRGDYNMAQNYAQKLLNIDPTNQQATFMLSNLMLLRSDPTAAVNCIQDLLRQKPDNFEALSQLVVLMRRAGLLKEIVPFLERAKESTSHKSQAGLNYAQGLYNRYTGQPNAALKFFNLCRNDGMYGKRAIIHMIEIFLNPDNQILWSSQDDSPLINLKGEDLEAVKILLSELNAKYPSSINRVYQAYTLVHSGKKELIDRAIKLMMELNKEEKDFAPALVILAVCKYFQKKQNEGRNFLKTLSKLVYQPIYAEHFEMGWLMLADFLITQGKYDQAEEYCRQCLKYNRSQVKAQEFMGIIKEREKSFVNAAQHYEQAWQLSSKQAPTIGFRLAFNYLKGKRLVEAIDICHQVLQNFPDYPEIKEKVLIPARMALRN